MTDDEEGAYIMGGNQAWRHILGEAIRHLGPDGDADRWRLERADAVSALRDICAKHGDNDWPDTLHLADVLEKHLHRHLTDRDEDLAGTGH